MVYETGALWDLCNRSISGYPDSDGNARFSFTRRNISCIKFQFHDWIKETWIELHTKCWKSISALWQQNSKFAHSYRKISAWNHHHHLIPHIHLKIMVGTSPFPLFAVFPGVNLCENDKNNTKVISSSTIHTSVRYDIILFRNCEKNARGGWTNDRNIS